MTDIELERGYKLTFENVKRLIEEADGLNIFERYERAYTIYQLAIEEIGKCGILYRAILENYLGKTINNDYLKKEGFFHHQTKTLESLKYEIIVIKQFEEYIGKETGLIEETLNDYDNLEELNDKKNDSLYVGIKDEKFYAPNIQITKEITDNIAFKAHLRFKAIEPFLQPLDKMREIANGVNELFSNTEKVKELENKYTLK